MTLIQMVDTPPPCCVCGQRMTRERDGWSCQDPDCDARGYVYRDDWLSGQNDEEGKK